jgi:hypothetical protein
MRRATAILAIAYAFVAMSAVPAATNEGQDELSLVRTATDRYHDESVALADGYVRTDECVELPGVGGMGFHYVQPSLMDASLDIERPEILVYAPSGSGGRRLVAVEYFQPDADQDLATDDDRPGLFGVPFDGPMPGHVEGMPVHYDLHAWVWQANPAGTFAQWNPNVACS